MLSTSGESGNLCLVPDFRSKTLSFTMEYAMCFYSERFELCRLLYLCVLRAVCFYERFEFCHLPYLCVLR